MTPTDPILMPRTFTIKTGKRPQIIADDMAVSMLT